MFSNQGSVFNRSISFPVWSGILATAESSSQEWFKMFFNSYCKMQRLFMIYEWIRLFWICYSGLDLGEKLLPEILKDNGYETHMVGKWHLGYCNSSYLPNNRGFDKFFGLLGPAGDYKTHLNGRGHLVNGVNILKPFKNFLIFWISDPK